MKTSETRRQAPAHTRVRPTLPPTEALVIERDRYEVRRGRSRRTVTLSRKPPPGVTVVENHTGEGAWILKWQAPKSGKTQYAYDTQTIVDRRGAMFAQNLVFGSRHSEIVERYRRDIRDGVGRVRIVATMIALVDQACFRPGSERSVDELGHFGLTTLRAEHVCVRANRVTFEYVGKAGVEQRRIVTDAAIARVVKELARHASPSAPFFSLEGRAIRPEALNAYLPDGLTVKMFRAFHATRIAARALVEARHRFGRVIPEDQRPALLADAYALAARHLGNTPAICKTNYVDPTVVHAICEGEDR